MGFMEQPQVLEVMEMQAEMIRSPFNTIYTLHREYSFSFGPYLKLCLSVQGWKILVY